MALPKALANSALVIIPQVGLALSLAFGSPIFILLAVLDTVLGDDTSNHLGPLLSFRQRFTTNVHNMRQKRIFSPRRDNSEGNIIDMCFFA